jgi:SAM-dependent methyltransferase
MAGQSIHGGHFDRVDEQPEPSRWVDYLDGHRDDPGVAARKAWALNGLQLRDGDAVLDVGCGTGEDVVVMAKVAGAAGRAIGLDASAIMLTEARRRCVAGAWCRGDARSLPFRSASFDACWAERVMVHVVPAEAVLGELVRVLRPGGRLVVTEPDHDTRVVGSPHVDVGRLVNASFIARGNNRTVGRQLRGLLVAEGLADVVVEGRVLTFTDYATAGHFLFLEQAANDAVTDGLITESAGQAWLASLQEASDAGRFFAAVTYFTAVGRRP